MSKSPLKKEILSSSSRSGEIKAAAVKYKTPDSLPTILSSGEGETARKIIELAESHGIPVHEDSSLAALLQQIPEGADVPDVAFSLIAEVLCFLYEIDVRWRDQHGFMAGIIED